MSNGKVLNSFGAATLKAREVEDNFVRETTSICYLVDRNDLVGLLVHQQRIQMLRCTRMMN